MSLYGLKMTCLGVFRIEEIRDKDNETGLIEGDSIEMSTTVLPLRDARSPSLCIYLPGLKPFFKFPGHF